MDLVAIKHRLRGLAADFYKSHKTELANKSKARVRSKKYQGGAGLKRCNLLGGIVQIGHDIKK